MSYHFHYAPTTTHLVPHIESSRTTLWPLQHAPVQTPGAPDLRRLAVDAVNAALDALDAAGDYVRSVAF